MSRMKLVRVEIVGGEREMHLTEGDEDNTPCQGSEKRSGCHAGHRAERWSLLELLIVLKQ